jgi:hypothetical protein
MCGNVDHPARSPASFRPIAVTVPLPFFSPLHGKVRVTNRKGQQAVLRCPVADLCQAGERSTEEKRGP